MSWVRQTKTRSAESQLEKFVHRESIWKHYWDREQGDLIGRIFAYWATVYFRQFFALLFSTEKVVFILAKYGLGYILGDFFIWDRCYDFLNIFAEKFSEKFGFFDSKQS
jgi:hypothetical protein